LRIPQDAKILIFTANSIRKNIWKDYQTMRSAVTLVAKQLQVQNLLFIALGEKAPADQIDQATVRFIPFQSDPSIVAQYYQAADVYLHAARADTFPNTVLEALACGKPVVATAVGGIPEQIEDGVTGFLTPPGDAEAMAARVAQLLANDELREKVGQQAAESARQCFDLERQASEYLKWYEDIVLLHHR
jgi:glycosyltransferase involved in cell wall biosynthesis